MKPISKYLSNFIDNNLLGYKNLPKLSLINKQFLLEIYNEIEQSKLYVNNETLTKKIISEETLPKGVLYDSLDNFIKNKIESNLRIGFHYNFKVLNRSNQVKNINAFIIFIFENKEEKENTIGIIEDYIDQCAKNIYTWLYTIRKYIPDNCSNTLDIYLYLTDLYKFLPDDKRVSIGIKHVNTAFTTSCSLKTDIHIFRLEEWFKVFIHETFHSLGLDFSSNTDIYYLSEKSIKNIFNIPNIKNIKLFETYCEIWAEIVNILFIIRPNKSEKSNNYIINKIEKYLLYERIYSLFQTAKILDHYELDYTDLIKNKIQPTYKLIEKNTYKEETDAFCYYIIKSILMYDINNFLNFVRENENYFKFVETKENINKFVYIINLSHTNEKYIEIIKGLKQFIEKNKKNKKKLEYRTMRMSIFG
jgi:hypothetical protein